MAIRLAPCLALCCAAHFVVDFACALAVVTLPSLWGLTNHRYYLLVIAYNLTAFLSQPFWGWLLDRRASYAPGAAAGVLASGLGVLAAALHPLAGAFVLGCGNAIFHVGAGALVYEAAPGKAGGPGLFVAPGGIGIVAGLFTGSRGLLAPLWLLPLLGVTALALLRLAPVAETGEPPAAEKESLGPLLPALLFLLLLVVGLRSFAGFALPAPWKSGGMPAVALAVFAGKASGGFLADRMGWRPFCVFMLLGAAAAGLGHRLFLPAACAALFCIQSTTGITLAAVQSLFPGRPALAFGLPCVALVFGAFPFFLPRPAGRISPDLAAVLCLSMALAAFFALSFLKSKEA